MRLFLLISSVLVCHLAIAQFHTLTMPKASPAASIRQQIGVTFMEIKYNSPSVNDRDVWNDPNVIPQNGDPIPWRAGANENTIISFDTDVKIEGQTLSAGSYGFHIIPHGHEHTLLFAQPDNLWGSYYLDLDRDVVLSVTVKDTTASFSEHLTFAVSRRTQDNCQVALHWADRAILFDVSVDLERTAVEKWRYELNGENTYNWRAWNDVAAWCLRHDTNLEEALTWVNRSINGGYGGFAGHNSLINLSTKVEILHALAKKEELKQTIEGLKDRTFTADEGHYMGDALLRINRDENALRLMQEGLRQHPNDFGMQLYEGIAYYYLGKTKSAIKSLKNCKENCPEWFAPRIDAIQTQMEAGTYQYPQRNS